MAALPQPVGDALMQLDLFGLELRQPVMGFIAGSKPPRVLG